MINTKNSKHMLEKVLILVIGKPGAGKSTVINFLLRDFKSIDYLYQNEYEMLKRRIKQLSNKQINMSETGEFVVKDRNIFGKISLEMINNAKIERNRDVLIFEFARKNYSKLINKFMTELGTTPLIIYVSSSLSSCINRNKLKSRTDPINAVPSAVIKKYYNDDDFQDVAKKHKDKVIFVDNSNISLVELHRRVKSIYNQVLVLKKDKLHER